jgi:hypothetical protein
MITIPSTLVLALYAYGFLTIMSVLWLITITRLVSYEGSSAFTVITGSLGGIGTVASFSGLVTTLINLALVI